MHVQVGEFDLDDPLLDQVWGLLAEAGTPVVVHAGHAPVGNGFTGPAPLARVLAAHPALSSSSPTWGRRTTWTSWRWPTGTRGCTWTPR